MTRFSCGCLLGALTALVAVLALFIYEASTPEGGER